MWSGHSTEGSRPYQRPTPKGFPMFVAINTPVHVTIVRRHRLVAVRRCECVAVVVGRRVDALPVAVSRALPASREDDSKGYSLEDFLEEHR